MDHYFSHVKYVCLSSYENCCLNLYIYRYINIYFDLIVRILAAHAWQPIITNSNRKIIVNNKSMMETIPTKKVAIVSVYHCPCLEIQSVCVKLAPDTQYSLLSFYVIVAFTDCSYVKWRKIWAFLHNLQMKLLLCQWF